MYSQRIQAGMKKCFLAMLLLLLIAFAAAGMAEEETRHPMLDPMKIQYTELEDEYLNILFAGIDFGHQGYWGSHGKKRLEECHTDAMMVVSLNKRTGKLDLISLPRDTVTYVPGVKGLYKLNGAINCGESIGEGLERACEAVSWLLGGVEVSKYCAVDMNTMIALGDVIGGVDYEMDMAYTGHSGRRYTTGMQHLDGLGIMDYLRSRTNATRDGTDIGRTGRQRNLMIALFTKIRNAPELLDDVLKTLMEGRETILTNISFVEMASMIPPVLKVQPKEIGSHVLNGSYMAALDGWNFTFTNQEHRQKILKKIYNLDVEPIPYVSKKYCDWLEESGLRTVRYISCAQAVYDYAQGCSLTQEQAEAVAAFGGMIEEVRAMFVKAADTLLSVDRNVMATGRAELRKAGEKLMAELSYPEQVNWAQGPVWYDDPCINEYQYKWQ